MQINVYAQTAALFSSGDADVVIARGNHRKPAKHHITVSAAFQLPVFSQPKIQFQFACDEMRLIVLVFLTLHAMNFLQGDDVGVNFAQHFDDAFGTQTAIKADTFVNIVSGNSESFYFPHKSLFGVLLNWSFLIGVGNFKHRGLFAFAFTVQSDCFEEQGHRQPNGENS